MDWGCLESRKMWVKFTFLEWRRFYGGEIFLYCEDFDEIEQKFRKFIFFMGLKIF